VFRVLYMVVGGLILLFFGSLAWNRSLQGKVQERTRELRESEATLRESEERYRSLYSTTNEGVALHEVLYDESGEAADYRILDINPAFEFIIGIKREDVIGAKASELYGTGEAPYLKIYAKVAASGEPVTFETTFEPLAKSFKISVFSPAVGRFATLFADITDRKQAEEALQRRAEELAVLNALNQRVSASLSLDQVGKSAIEGIVNSTHPDLALIFLREGDRLFLKWAAPDNSKFIHEETHVHCIGECLCGLAVTERKPIYSVNIYIDPRCTWNECKKAGAHSLAAFPLRSGDHIIGVFGLASGTERIFEDQAAFLETLSSQISIGLQNALLHEELKSHAARLDVRVSERTDELEKKNRDLERFNKLFVDRELRMAELKKEIKKLREEA